MSNSIHRLCLMACLSLPLLLNRCGFADMYEKSNKITSVIRNNCDCEEVSLLEYNISNLITTASYKLVGCEFENIDQEAIRVTDILKDSIPDFCKIEYFNLVFVNKGQQQVKQYYRCQDK